MSSLRKLFSAICQGETSIIYLGFFSVVEKKKGIILAIPITWTFILLNEGITCTALVNSENNEPLEPKRETLIFSDVH